ncbi:MAG: hypothetical protein JXD22_09210 [Sedimentisphaerales bacterium]|nr:hypothetical protein [Sedimentisphaerales bacterium]
MDAGEDKGKSTVGLDAFRCDAILIVGDQDRLKQLAGLVVQSALTDGDSTTKVIFCADVYEAAAEMVEQWRAGRRLLLCVMVDYLRSQEMRIFASGVRINGVSTVAFSVFDNRAKLIQAQSLGADEIYLDLDQLQVRLEAVLVEWSQPGPVNMEMVNLESASLEVCKSESRQQDRKIVDPIINEITNRDIASAKNAPEDLPPSQQMPMEVRKITKKSTSRSIDEPLLSREELDALLGNGN